MQIVAVGLNHKVAPVAVREQLAFTRPSLEQALCRFRTKNGATPYAPEGIILSTCNRLEMYLLSPNQESGQDAACRFLEACHNCGRSSFEEYLYRYVDAKAFRHLAAVASGLDSMILGEPQILGQVTESMEIALKQGTAGKVLSALFRHAITAGKRARTETAISRGAASVSRVAVELAQRIFGDLEACHVLLVGAGEMAELAARAMVACGAGRLSILNRTQERAEELAAQLGAQALGWDRLSQALQKSDIVITSTGAPHAIFRPEAIRRVQPQRRNRPLFFIDIAVPRNVDPAVQDLESVYLYDIDDLQNVAQAGLAERRKEIPKVERIIAQEEERFMDWFSSLGVVPTIVALREEVEAVRQAELERALRRLDALSDRQREIVQGMSLRIVNKILHQPITQLRKHASQDEGLNYAAVLRDLFGLDRQGGSS